MVIWTIRNFREESNRLWIELKSNKNKCISGFTIKLDVLPLILKHYKSEVTKQVIGKTFHSTSDDPFHAIEIFTIELKTKKKYVAPPAKKILRMCIDSLAEMKEPNLELIDETSIMRAFLSVWGPGEYPDPQWLKSLNDEIAKKSDNTVSLQKTKRPKKYLPKVLGPAYCCDLVSIYGRRVTIFIGPYGTPIIFLKPPKLPLQK